MQFLYNFFECFFFDFFKFAGNRSHSFCFASDGKLRFSSGYIVLDFVRDLF